MGTSGLGESVSTTILRACSAGTFVRLTNVLVPTEFGMTCSVHNGHIVENVNHQNMGHESPAATGTPQASHDPESDNVGIMSALSDDLFAFGGQEVPLYRPRHTFAVTHTTYPSGAKY
jgi:hypothetical protein